MGLSRRRRRAQPDGLTTAQRIERLEQAVGVLAGELQVVKGMTGTLVAAVAKAGLLMNTTESGIIVPPGAQV